MKTHEFLTSFLLIIFLQSICSVCFAVDENHPGYHIIKGVPQTPGYNSEYIFKNTPDDIPFIITFSLNKLLNDPEIVEIEREAYVGQVVFSIRTNENIKVWLQYWIYTAVSDAEVALVERFCTSNLGRDNAIDIGREGEIGDNCWYSNYAVEFIRNNIRISIINWTPSQPETMENIAKKVDKLLLNEEKVTDPSLIPAPIIESIENLSGEPKLNKPVTLKIHAKDPFNKQLTYRFWGQPLGVSWEDGIIKPFFENTGINKLKIWVMNDDFIVSSTELTF